MQVEVKDSPGQTDLSICRLPDIVEDLPPATRSLVCRFYGVVGGPVRMIMGEGEEEQLIEQQVVTISANFAPIEDATFNWARVLKPTIKPKTDPVEIIKNRINGCVDSDPFCQWRKKTPRDIFGRLENVDEDGKQEHVTCANLFAGGYPFHSVIVDTQVHSPLEVPSEDKFLREMELADRWYKASYSENPAGCHPSFIHNSLEKSGASVLHNHSQVYNEAGYIRAGMRVQINTASFYHHLFDGDFYDHQFEVYQALGLGTESEGVRIISPITPTKEAEILFFAANWGLKERKTFYKVWRYMVREQGMVAYNLCVAHPRIGHDRDAEGYVPNFASFLNRGDPLGPADFGGSEAGKPRKTSIIATDPYRVQEYILTALAT